MANLIPTPDLDLRNEELLAAQAIAYVSGGLTVERIDSQIEILRQLRTQVEAGLDQPICPELTNANPSSPHTVILEAQAWMVAQVTRRINQLPVRDQIEFARLFGIELREATPATVVLTFTVDAPNEVDVTIPADTEITTADGLYLFETDAILIIPNGTLTGTVAATRTNFGKTNLAANTLIQITDPIAYVEAVTNFLSVNSGSNAETIDEALVRARNYQRRGERLVGAIDFEDAIREEVLFGNGIVKAFPFVTNGDFENLHVGHTTIVVMTFSGEPVTDDEKQKINELLSQAVGNQFIYVVDPTFVDFNVTAEIVVNELVSELATLALVEKNLQDFYAARNGKFGVPTLRSEIIAVIEGTAGVESIVPQIGGEILISPINDVEIAPYELVRLVNVNVSIQ